MDLNDYKKAVAVGFERGWLKIKSPQPDVEMEAKRTYDRERMRRKRREYLAAGGIK